MKKNILIILILLNVLFSNVSLAQRNKASHLGSIRLNFNHYVGDSLLKLDSNVYVNNLNQDFSVSLLKYYVSNVSLININSEVIKLPNTFFLISADDKSTSNIIINDIPYGVYKEISFILGVDSLHNCNGIQSGSLDPINGMFWEWNTGYIFLKLEGNSSHSKATANTLEYHIGGYMEPNNFIRNISLSVDGLSVSDDAFGILDIKLDVLEILKNPISIDFVKMPVVTDFKNASLIANNYTDIFSIIRVSSITTKK